MNIFLLMLALIIVLVGIYFFIRDTAQKAIGKFQDSIGLIKRLKLIPILFWSAVFSVIIFVIYFTLIYFKAV